MIDKEKFGKFQKVLTSGSVDMQGVKAREWTGLSGDDHNEILANYTSYADEFLNADTKLEPEPIAEPAPDLSEEEPEVEEPEDNGPSDSEIDEAEIENQVEEFYEGPEEEADED